MSAENHRPAGVPDRAALQTSMREAAQKAQELRQQAEAARNSLHEAAAKVQELEQQATAAQRMITLYQEQEGAIAHALQDAQKMADEVVRSAKARAEELVGAAKSAAEGITQSARTAAAETLQKARESAQAQLKDAERAAAEHAARLRAESERVAEESTRKVRQVQEAAEQYLSSVTVKLDAFVRDREAMARGLDALARNHAESLQTLTRLRSEVQSQILPAVQRLLRRLKGEDAGEADAAAPAAAVPAPVSSAGPAEPAPAEVPPATAAAPAEVREEASVPGARHNGEIVVSPIYSFLQATKFMTALSQLKGVVSVKLRTYAGAKATIEVVTEGPTVGGINCKAIDGFAVEVMESNETKLVLRIAAPAARAVPG